MTRDERLCIYVMICDIGIHKYVMTYSVEVYIYIIKYDVNMI